MDLSFGDPIFQTKGASMIKWTSPKHCIGLCESDTKLYANFEVCEEKIINIKKKHIDLQRQVIYIEKKLFKNNLHIYSASGVQVGDIEQVIV